MLVLDRPLEKHWDLLVQNHCSTQQQQQKKFIMTKKVIPTVGFLVGDRLAEQQGGDCFVLHLALCPLPESIFDEEDSKSKDGGTPSRSVTEYLDEDWISVHECQLMRMLPGGLEVIGLFLVADRVSVKLLNPLVLKSLRLLAATNAKMNFHPQSDERVTMFLVTQETPLGKPQALSASVSKSGVYGTCSTRLSYQSLQWAALESNVSFDFCAEIPSGRRDSDFRTQFIEGIQPVVDSILAASGVVNGKFRDPRELIFPKHMGRHKGGSLTDADSGKFAVDLLAKYPLGSKRDSVVVGESGGRLKFEGTLQSFAVVSQKNTVSEAIARVKQDIIRSLYSRCQLHYEGMMVVEGEDEDLSAIHQLPRRVYLPHSLYPCIKFSDYLFEGDTTEDALESFRDLLQVEVSADQIRDDVESPPTAEILQKLNVPIPICEPEALDTSTKVFQAAEAEMRSRFVMWPVLYTVLAFLFGLLSYILYLLLS